MSDVVNLKAAVRSPPGIPSPPRFPDLWKSCIPECILCRLCGGLMSHLYTRTPDRFKYNLPSALIYVDKGGVGTFEIPVKWLATSQVLAGFSEEPGQPIWLHSVTVQDFVIFQRWLHQDQIITYWHDPNNLTHEDPFDKLIEAVVLGIYLECPEYQLAAMREFLAHSQHLSDPEYYVHHVWAATEAWADSEAFDSLTALQKQHLVHPMRKLLVAIVAVKTVGMYERDVMGRPGRCAREEEISIGDFWEMYEDYEFSLRKNWQTEIDMPESVEQFL